MLSRRRSQVFSKKGSTGQVEAVEVRVQRRAAVVAR